VVAVIGGVIVVAVYRMIGGRRTTAWSAGISRADPGLSRGLGRARAGGGRPGRRVVPDHRRDRAKGVQTSRTRTRAAGTGTNDRSTTARRGHTRRRRAIRITSRGRRGSSWARWPWSWWSRWQRSSWVAPSAG